MKITATMENPHRDLVAGLYAAVDALDANEVGAFIAPDVRFQLGNFDETRGRQAVIDANAAFFRTIAAMRHTITGLWSEGRTVICAGSVQYTRKDTSQLEIPFATVLTLDDDRIADYRVYADISPL